ncbi:unnamed protein product [Calicophoron daubneyi]|uniref:Anion exchange protein n=1 Tax=Calicophoron daubneyi TaxID=300641 RepID=A0AAV2U0D7_CALDB
MLEQNEANRLEMNSAVGGRVTAGFCQPCRHYNSLLASTLDQGTEACSVMCGTVEFLRKPILILVHLDKCIENSCLLEVNIPVRFIFVYLGLPSTELNYSRLARVFAVMMSNSHFCSSVQRAKEISEIVDAVDYFMHDALVMPVNRFVNNLTLGSTLQQIEYYKEELEEGENLDKEDSAVLTATDPENTYLAGETATPARQPTGKSLVLNDLELIAKETDGLCGDNPERPVEPLVSKRRRFMQTFCPPFADLRRSLRPWINRMPGDYRDAFKKENVGTVFGTMMFLYFLSLGPAITYAAFLNTQVDPSFTISGGILATGIGIIVYTLLAGQPMGLVGISVGTLILESAIASVAKQNNMELGQLRFWTAIYCSALGVILVMLNASVLANHVRQSVEEIYNSLVALFVIVKSPITMFRLIPSVPTNPTSSTQIVVAKKMAIAGATLFLAFFKLHFCLLVAKIKNGTYFRRTVRLLLGYFNIPLGILFVTALDQIFFRDFNLPKLNIPPSNQVNFSNWASFPKLTALTSYGQGSALTVHGMALAFGLALGIIIFIELAVNEVTAMRNKAVKPGFFVIDIIVVQIILPVCYGVLGWPFVSGATVRTLNNVLALTKMEMKRPPGLPPQIIGTVEQRVSNLFAGLLVALSVFLGSVLRFIPLAALYGLFLFLGISGLQQLVYIKRLLAILRRRKHWRDWEWVRGLPHKHILVFALIELIVALILVSLNIVAEFTTATYTGVLFPAVIILYGVIREAAYPKWAWLAPYLHRLDKKQSVQPSGASNPAQTYKALPTTPKKSVVNPPPDQARSVSANNNLNE